MNRLFVVKLTDQHDGTKAEYRAKVQIDAASIHIDVKFPGDEEGMARSVWIEANGGDLVVRTYDPEHEGPMTTLILMDGQNQHTDGYE